MSKMNLLYFLSSFLTPLLMSLSPYSSHIPPSPPLPSLFLPLPPSSLIYPPPPILLFTPGRQGSFMDQIPQRWDESCQ